MDQPTTRADDIVDGVVAELTPAAITTPIADQWNRYYDLMRPGLNLDPMLLRREVRLAFFAGAAAAQEVWLAADENTPPAFADAARLANLKRELARFVTRDFDRELARRQRRFARPPGSRPPGSRPPGSRSG